jgi:hypothetical protein
MSIALRDLHSVLDHARREIEVATGYADILSIKLVAKKAYDDADRLARLGKAKGAHDELVASAHRLKADALEIEAAAARKLADEYDGAQERGEIGQSGARSDLVPDGNEVVPSAADAGISRKEIFEARIIRDAEELSPGIVRRSLTEMLIRGDDPTRAQLRREIVEAAAHIRQERTAEKKERRQERETDLGERQSALPDKRYGVMLAARAGPPFLPMADAAGSTPRSSGVGSRSSTSPVRISTMSLASWFVSRGRFWPLGLEGISCPPGTFLPAPAHDADCVLRPRLAWDKVRSRLIRRERS